MKKFAKVYMKTLKIIGGILTGTLGLLELIKTLVFFVQENFL